MYCLIIWMLIATPTAFAQATQCSGLQLVFGRATGEPSASKNSWSKGYGAAGYSLLTNLTKLVPDVTGYPVNYPASVAGQSTERGAKDMIQHLTSAAKRCPKQKFALGGHSQGGNVTYHAIPRLSPDVLSRIIAVTMFGSPKCPPQVKDRCKSYCYKGDFACDGSDGGAFGRGGVNGVAKGKGKGLGKGLGKGIGRLIDDECVALAKIGPTGHQPKAKGMPHMVYNSDGYYIRAAACFIAVQYQKSSAKSVT